MSEQAKESSENLSEIQRLTDRAHDLSVSIGHWNNAYMVFVAGAVVLAGLVFITQFVASRKGQSLAETQEALIAEKDRVAGIDSKDKDGKIAAALQTAGDSNEKAEKAGLEATDAKRDFVATQLELAKQQTRAAIAERSLLELQEKLKWRSISAEQKSAFLGTLAGRKATKAEVIVLGRDAESFAFAKQVRSLLAEAGWEVPEVKAGLQLGETSSQTGLTITLEAITGFRPDPLDPKRELLGNPPPLFFLSAESLKTAFEGAGFAVEVKASPNHSEDMVTVAVGAKP